MWVFFGLIMAMVWSRHWGGDWSGRGRRRGLSPDYERRIQALEAEVSGREDTIALLESRVAELESRLDFTERLIMQPKATNEQLAVG